MDAEGQRFMAQEVGLVCPKTFCICPGSSKVGRSCGGQGAEDAVRDVEEHPRREEQHKEPGGRQAGGIHRSQLAGPGAAPTLGET